MQGSAGTARRLPHSQPAPRWGETAPPPGTQRPQASPSPLPAAGTKGMGGLPPPRQPCAHPRRLQRALGAREWRRVSPGADGAELPPPRSGEGKSPAPGDTRRGAGCRSRHRKKLRRGKGISIFK